MTSMTTLVPLDDRHENYLSDELYRTLGPLVDQPEGEAPRLPGFCTVFYPHVEGRVFLLQKGKQVAAAGAVARTPRAARELWSVLFKLRSRRLPETKPAGKRHPGHQIWGELALMDFTGLSPSEGGMVGLLGTQLLGALIRRQLDFCGSSHRVV